MFFNEVYIVRTTLEFRMFQYINQEVNICFYTANTEFFQATKHFTNSFFVVRTKCCRFHKQGVIVRCYNGTCKSITRIKTDTKTTGATVRQDFTGIRHKVVFRIFCGNTTLDSSAFTRNFILLRNTYFRTM